MVSPSLLVSLCAAVLAASPLLVDRIVAMVDDQAITQSELQESMKAVLTREAKVDQASRQRVEREQLERLIEARLIAAEAKRLSIGVTEKEIDLGIDDVARERNITRDEVIVEAGKQFGVSPREYRVRVRDNLLAWKWTDRLDARLTEHHSQAERAVWHAHERERLLSVLRARATIEIRP